MFCVLAAYIPYRCIANSLGTVERFVDGEAQAASLVHHGAAKTGTPLADSSRENDCVYLTSKRDVVAPNETADAIHKQVESQAMLGLIRGGNDAEIGSARQRFPTARLVEDLFSLGDVELLCCGRGELAYIAGVMED